MLMSKNVNNDVSKDSPIDCIFSDPPRASDKHWRCLRELEGNVGEDFVLKIVYWLSPYTLHGPYQALLLAGHVIVIPDIEKNYINR